MPSGLLPALIRLSPLLAEAWALYRRMWPATPAKKKALRPEPRWWSHAHLRRVRFHAPDYRFAARKVGVIWRLLPTTHKVERNMSDKEVTGGWAQLDMGAASPEAGRAKRDAYVARVMKLYGIREYGPLRSDFRTGAIICAHILLCKVPRRLKGQPWTDEKIAETLFGYNGRASYYNERWQTGQGSSTRSWRWSPYVANFMNGRQLYVKGRQYHKGKRVQIARKKYRSPGALLVYRELRALGTGP